jgi:hypothetical protein
MMAFKLTACGRVSIAVLLTCSASFATHAQQTPITGQMLAPAASAPASEDALPTSAPPAAPMQAALSNNTAEVKTQVGEVTHQLLNMQSQGTHAGKRLSTPGPEASASYERYLKSFEHPIPDFYDTAVSKNGGTSSGSSSSP